MAKDTNIFDFRSLFFSSERLFQILNYFRIHSQPISLYFDALNSKPALPFHPNPPPLSGHLTFCFDKVANALLWAGWLVHTKSPGAGGGGGGGAARTSANVPPMGRRQKVLSISTDIKMKLYFAL